jgi:2-keto-3-deoxy-galactonokinase
MENLERKKVSEYPGIFGRRRLPDVDMMRGQEES